MKERREFLRYDCHLILAVRSDQSKVVEFEGQAVNISRSGVTFTTSMDLNLSQLVMIAFDTDDDTQLYAEGIVVRKDEQDPRGHWTYAIRFPMMLSGEELEMLLALSAGGPN